jgi:hypothetical protein
MLPLIVDSLALIGCFSAADYIFENVKDINAHLNHTIVKYTITAIIIYLYFNLLKISAKKFITKFKI